MISFSSRKSLVASSDVMYTNAVYFPNHRIYQGDTPGMLNYSCVNQVYYAYASISADGGVFLSDEWADARAPVDGVHGGLGSLMHLKQKHPHLQVVLSIGGAAASDLFSLVAANTLSRDNFARSARGLVEASGLDGIDIAWEYPSDAKQGCDFLALLAAIRIHLPEDNFTLTAVLPASKAILQFIDLKMATDYLDHINLIAFDFFGSWTPKSGHHAQLHGLDKDEISASSGVAHLITHGFPAKKILLGIPTHGRIFSHTARSVHKFSGDVSLEYRQLPLQGSTETLDKRHVAAQCFDGNSSFVSYDNPETVKLKANFCKQNGLGGLFYSNGPVDSKDMCRSLIAAGFRSLHTS